MHKLFASQLDDEKIYLVVRRHWFFLAKRIIVVLLFAIGYGLFMNQGPSIAPGLFEGTLGQITAIISALYVLGILFALLVVWTLYYLNIQIITDIRIVDVDQISLIARTVSELNIENIQDVTSEAHGLFSTIFGFGDIFVQTAGIHERFVFESVPHSEEIKRLLIDLYEKEQQKPKPVTPHP